MQEIQSIDGGVGRLFVRDGADQGGGERRLKPHQYSQGFAAGAGHGYQALKCPRCDSLNTKFCYYNNYNLSQPRYFCKGCRRYWTKGGVLRNVPVGGGCRKNKRSKQNSGDVDLSSAQRKPSDSKNSSSDSSSLTGSKAKATTPTPFTLTEAPIPPTKLFQESYTVPQSSTVNKCATDNRHHHDMLSEMETFKSLLTSSSDQVPLAFNFINPATEVVPSFMEQQDVVEKQEESKWKQQWMDETTYNLRTSNGGVAAEDWEGGGGGEGLFDQSYWSQISWSNQLNYFN